MSASSSKQGLPSSSRSREKPSVSAILRGMGIKRQAASSGFSLPVPSSEKLGSANRESNVGMRPPVDKKGKGKEKEKGKGKKKDRSTSFKVSSVVVVGCGTEFVGHSDGDQRYEVLTAKNTKTPSKVAIQNASLNGMGVNEPHDGIIMDSSWDHTQLTDYLRMVVPKPFLYFDAQAGASNDNDPAWYLGTNDCRKLAIVPTKEPTGADVKYYRGNSGTGFHLCHVWIVSAEPIPADIVASWIEDDSLAFRKPAEPSSDDDGEESSASLSPAPFMPKNPSKRRLFSHSSDEEDPCHNLMYFVMLLVGAVSSRKWSRLPDLFTDGVAQEISASGDFIDLTKDEVGANTSLPDWASVLTPSKLTEAVDPLYTRHSEPDMYMPEGNPYGRKVYEFK
ncbi:hypothetical protein B0H15DRAFT_942020 [Mycena belliarum]|uniref:Uncharacterized protein n=1 Tax=Mycena belliarum TaxID=1033014 RepID=A0AAD6UIB1_9AGAR|nr:hypothetical protein B0H15DRAFT_942020 [Mycena belliae]